MSAGRPVRPAPLKRLIDIVASAGGLVVLSPVLLILWLLVRRRMGSPALFRQVRPGLHGQPFEMIKFRTMRDATGPDGQPLPDAERLTDFGRWLRATSLDELPELWNVLKGDMSLVGPRPLLKKYLPFYLYEERRRLSVRPGITGWAQVNGRNALPWDDRLAADIWYINNRSIVLDLSVLVATVARIVDRDGAVADPRSTMLDLDVERRDRLLLRRLEVCELQTAAELIRSVYDPALFKHTIIASPHFAKFFSEVVGRSGEVFGAFRDEKLVGVFEARHSRDGFYLNNFAVSAMEQGWGVAGLLLVRLRELAGGRPVRLHVDSRNAPAHRFYRKQGYREVEATTMTTLNVADERKHGELPLRVVEDVTQYVRYGVGYLKISGDGPTFGLIGPNHLVAPIGVSHAELDAACSLPGIERLTVLGEPDHLPCRGRLIATWKRIEMVCE